VTGEKWAVRWVDGWCHIKLNRVEIILIMNLDNSAEANWAVSSKRALNSQSTKLAYTYSSMYITWADSFGVESILFALWKPPHTRAEIKGAFVGWLGCWWNGWAGNNDSSMASFSVRFRSAKCSQLAKKLNIQI